MDFVFAKRLPVRNSEFCSAQSVFATNTNPGSIDSQREEHIRRVLETLHNTLGELRDGSVSCAYECDSFLLGSLTKALHRHGLATPHLSGPYLGISVASLLEAVVGIKKAERSLRSIRNQQGTRKRKSSWLGDTRVAPLPTPETSPEPEDWVEFDGHECATKNLITPTLNSLEANVEGLELVSSLGYYLY